MFRLILLFGLLTGVVVAALTLVVTTFGNPTEPSAFAQLIEFLTIVVVLLSCIFGMKWIRDRTPGSTITFPQALLVGLCICALASLVHCIAWEIFYYSNDYQFAREVSQHQLERAQLEGATAVEIAALMERNGKIVEAFANPFLRISMTLAQMFVIGAVVCVLGAFFFRNPHFWESHRTRDSSN